MSAVKPLFPPPSCFSFSEGFSSPDELWDTDVEKCLDDGALGRPATDDMGVVAEAVFVAVPFGVVLARNLDWEWLEK